MITRAEIDYIYGQLDAAPEEKTDRERFFGELSEGESVICPCCDRHAKIYRRQINAAMVLMLSRLASAQMKTADPCNAYSHISHFLGSKGVGSGDFGKLAYWGLIRPKPHDYGDEGKKYSGYWRITPDGLYFLFGEKKVPKYKAIYNGKVIGEFGEMVTVHECHGKQFDYNKIMDGVALT